MEQYMKCGCVVLAIVFLSLNVYAQPLATSVDNETNSNLPPFVFPKVNVTVGSVLPPNIFPKENVTVGSVLPPNIFPTENVTFGESPVPIQNIVKTTTRQNETVAELPPLIFPNDTDHRTPINKTALDILNAVGNAKREDMHILDDDYYKSNSSEYFGSDEVEEVQPNDNSPQNDNLEENYKSEMKTRPVLPTDELDDTEVDHPMLKNTHIIGIIGAVLAVACVCLYLGITIWRRITFNRYGMRERLINEDEFYNNKSIHHNF